MINFQILMEPDNIFEYVGQLWRSDAFKNSHYEKNGYINLLIKKFSTIPRIFFDMHKEQLEMVHFSSWFHAIQHRKYYIDPVIHDLYYHHEFFHLNTMEYVVDSNYEAWKEKMKKNEFWASLESEVLIYFYLPEIRSHSFKFQLWVDQFLEQDKFKSLNYKYNHYEDNLALQLKNEIAQARLNCETMPITDLDKMISDYTISSQKWAEIWQEDWYEVEQHMVQYLSMLKYHKEKAIQFHMNWLYHHIENDIDKVAFGKNAHAYSKVHRSLFKSAYEPIN